MKFWFHLIATWTLGFVFLHCDPTSSTVNGNPSVDSTRFSCQGKTKCTEMVSCEEAKFYLQKCPNTEIDGDLDGIPCESQWCLNG